MSNRSAVLHAPQELTIEDRAVPEPAPGEVLVRVVAVGICGSDVHYFEHGRIGPYVVEAPMVIGHEAAGVIVAVGAGREQRPGRAARGAGTRRSVPELPHMPVGALQPVPRRRVLRDPTRRRRDLRVRDAGLAFAHPVPAGLDHDHAAMAEPVSVGIWACRRAAVQAGDRVLVTGAGPIGLLTAQVARAFGATIGDRHRHEPLPGRQGHPARTHAQLASAPSKASSTSCSSAPGPGPP